MDASTLIAICIVFVPIHILTALCLYWIKQKVDLYEQVAIGIIRKSSDRKLIGGNVLESAQSPSAELYNLFISLPGLMQGN